MASVADVHGHYRIDVATPADDAGLRALLRRIPMTGPVAVTLRREPSFFAAMNVEGPFHQVLVARDTATGRIVGMGSRSVRLRWVDGHAQPVGYLGGLRLLPEARHTKLLLRGYRELARLHGDGRARFYVTTIAEGNQPAMSVLTRGRSGLPAYHDLGRYLTFVLPARARVPRPRDENVAIRPVAGNELPQLITFLNAAGQERLFFPYLTADDFAPRAATFRDLPLDHVLGAWRGGELVATLAAWDQSSFRQTVVEDYVGLVRWWTPVHQLIASLRGWPRFPAAGSPFAHVVLALPVVTDPGGADVFLQLLAAALRLRPSHGADAFLLGLFERDSLVETIRPLALHTYATRVFVVSWDTAAVKPEQFNGRNLYLELGCL